MTDTRTKNSGIVAYLSNSILECIEGGGSMGTPSGPMYAMLMGVGINLENYSLIMGALERAGAVTQRGHCYYPGPTIDRVKQCNNILIAKAGFPLAQSESFETFEADGYPSADVGIA